MWQKFENLEKSALRKAKGIVWDIPEVRIVKG
jgi:hypothetical protein